MRLLVCSIASVRAKSQLTLPRSRSPWQADTGNMKLDELVKGASVDSDGYVNVADQLGLSGIRGMRPNL